MFVLFFIICCIEKDCGGGGDTLQPEGRSKNEGVGDEDEECVRVGVQELIIERTSLLIMIMPSMF